MEINLAQSSKKTILGNKIVIKNPCEASSSFISQKYNLPEVICRLLTTRGFTIANKNIEDVENFLNPKIKNLLPDPFLLKDMQKAVEKVANSIEKNEKILIFADYDVDGATSSSLLYNYFTEIGYKNAKYHIPDRFLEGYGPNEKTFRLYEKQGFNLIITLDCGTSANQVIDAFEGSKTSIIVIDHHLSLSSLPKAYAIVNPNRLDEDGKLCNLATCGLCFLFLVALNRLLRNNGFFKKIKEPNLMNYLDLVSLGTVCDVMHLDILNRSFVKCGLNNFAKNNLGLQGLIDVSNINNKVSSYHLGFILGPRINAGGRLGFSMLGADLLCAKNKEDANEISKNLNALNIQRQEIEKNALDEAKNLSNNQIQNSKAIILYSPNWHQGVIGIIASRIKDEHNLPTFIGSLKDGIIKFSARSVYGIDIGSLIFEAGVNDLIVTGGGHKMAGGVSVKEEKIEEFTNFIKEKIANKFQNSFFEKITQIDVPISLAGINEKLVENLNLLEPFGAGNLEPKFLITNVKITKPKIISNKHISFLLTNTLKGEVEDGKNFTPSITFNCVETELGNFILSASSYNNYGLIGKIQKNNYSSAVQIKVEDVILN